ncbi:alpha/beta-hydrolase [Leucogyrophana mollusca]|uniref:Alpha/beta-hydrolase n=1 Tax=Leucogyrophana mollusca TaxID=85980 RepID=A0ACB8BA86_9AGAM|nr:alpha/beta-hydrolase [Leucogyrophana mollusca]
MLYTPVSRLLKSSDDTTIYAEAIGDPKKQSVVFVHGLGSSGEVYDSLFRDERLLGQLYLVRYDMRGHGRSGKPTDPASYSSSLYAADFAVVVAAYELKQPVHFGWSLGASVVADICAHVHPLPISGVVYVSALPHLGDILQAIGTPAVFAMLPGLLSEDADVSRQTRKAFVESMFSNPENVPADLKQSWLDCLSLLTPQLANLALTRGQDAQPLFEAGKNGLPLLVIGGTADSQVKNLIVAEKMKPYFKDLETCIIEGAGHAVFYDNQEEVVTALLSFIDRRITVDK